MSENSIEKKFIEEAEVIILNNMAEEQFGVAELAGLMNMSRSSLLRKIKNQSGLSVSQFIRKVRLEKSMDLLENTELNISEISYQVGFGNSSYYIKCFKEDFGYPPGEVRKRGFDKIIPDDLSQPETPDLVPISFFNQHKWPLLGSVAIIVGLFIFFISGNSKSKTETSVVKKSIAVLPFKNMSSDSTNLYFVNGLMESSLGNLQKIKDLRVISRTSVEKYRNTNKTSVEIAHALNVKYLVEGSGQREGNKVLLNIQLIDAINDTPIWSQQFNHEIVDVFALQNEIARRIAEAIKVKVTQSELEQIDKVPTDNLEAYDFYLQAQESLNKGTRLAREEAIALFERAIEKDEQFSLAYSEIAIAYFYLDMHQAEKQFTEIINNNADKALLYDSKSAQSLMAKALYYMSIADYNSALPHLEKALEYNPNSSSVIQFLSNIYSQAIPNTSKHLEYALKGIQIDLAAKDSISKSYIYLQLSNALVQTGFTEEAEKYINLSMAYYLDNEYGPILKTFIQLSQDQNISKATSKLVRIWESDTTRMDILQEVAKFYYFQEKYDSSYYYYEKFIEVKTLNKLDFYPQEDLKIGIVYNKMGLVDQAESFYYSYAEYCKNDKSIYQPVSMAVKYVHEGNTNLAINHLKEFSTKDNIQYWFLLFFDKDPLLKSFKNHPEVREIMKDIETEFWENQAQLEESLKELALL